MCKRRILKNGLAFSHCDIAIVTNVTADHIGLGGIQNLEQMAQVKAVLPETVFKHGFAILNAEDDLVYAMKKILIATLRYLAWMKIINV